MTRDWGPKNLGTSHADAGHDAEGAPQVVGSTDCASETSPEGTALRYKSENRCQRMKGGWSMGRAYLPEPDAADGDSRVSRRPGPAMGWETHKIPDASNIVAQTPPPLSAKACP